MSSIEPLPGGFEISTDRARLNVAAIHGYLTRSYWSPGIPRDTVERALANSLCFGLYAPGGAQAGLARVVTDYATFAYLCDVYVLEEHRGRGLSKALMRAVMAHPALEGARRAMLATRDAHGLYRQFGFETAPDNGVLMQVLRPHIYQPASG